MSRILMSRLLVAAAACAVAACGGGGGGGGGGGVGFIPPPPPATKTCPDGSVIPVAQACPQPPPPELVAIFPSVTTDTDFAVLGLEASAMNTAASALTKNGFSVRYDAGTEQYLIELPSIDEFPLQNSGENASFWSDGTSTGPDSDTGVNIFKPRSTNPEIQLAYTSFGTSSGYYATEFSFFAFGIPTPASGVPVTGSASYNALIVGQTLDSGGVIDGDATLQFNFGAGTLSGHLDPVLHYNGGLTTDLGSYDFVNTVFGVGSASFSGELSHSGTSTLGAFDGQFTGPEAQELMGRWTAPYLNPTNQQWKEMFGIMVGKKQ